MKLNNTGKAYADGHAAGYRKGYDAGGADYKKVAKQLQDALDNALAENLAMRDKLKGVQS